MDMSKMKKKGILGKGAQGQVYKVYSADFGKCYALKKDKTIEVDTKQAWMKKMIASELKKLANLRHQNIVGILSFGFEKDDFFEV